MNDKKQVVLTDEMADCLDYLIICRRDDDEVIVECRSTYEQLQAIGYVWQKPIFDSWVATDAGRAALAAHKAAQQAEPPSRSYQRNEPEWGGDVDNWKPRVDVEFGEWMFMKGVAFASQSEYADMECDECITEAFTEWQAKEGND